MKKWSNRLDPRRKRDKATPMRRLARSDAAKHINYNAAASSSSSSFEEFSESSLMTRSLEIPERTSFRIFGGGENEMDRIYQTLGLSGPDDLAISFDAWEASRNRSASDVINRLQSMELDSVLSEAVGASVAAEAASSDVADDSVNLASPESRMSGSFSGLVDRVVVDGGGVENRRALADNSADRDVDEVTPFENGSFIEDRRVFGRIPTIFSPIDGVPVGGGGIKGVRPPPVLKPPPAMKQPSIDMGIPSWDFIGHFGPPSETAKRPSSTSSSSSSRNGCDEEEGREVEREERFIQLEDTADESCSFTTNEGGSSSTVSNSSPIYASAPVITSWLKGQLLGRGSFGSVYEGISGDGDFFAVKEVSLLEQGHQAQESIQQLELEIALLSKLQHQNIVRYRGTDKDGSNLYIFLELVPQGSLYKLYQRYQFMDSQVSSYTRQILNGLKYLHDEGYIHRDIKCANILVDASGVVKLADFGLAKVSRLNDIKSSKGTPFWMAPEVIDLKRYNGYGKQADIWSLGCTVLEMLTRQIPYSHLEPVQALYQIGRGNLPELPETLSPDARDFIIECLRVNPLERPTAAELLNHPFLRKALPSTGSGSGSGSGLVRISASP